MYLVDLDVGWVEFYVVDFVDGVGQCGDLFQVSGYGIDGVVGQCEVVDEGCILVVGVGMFDVVGVDFFEFGGIVMDGGCNM